MCITIELNALAALQHGLPSTATSSLLLRRSMSSTSRTRLLLLLPLLPYKVKITSAAATVEELCLWTFKVVMVLPLHTPAAVCYQRHLLKARAASYMHWLPTLCCFCQSREITQGGRLPQRSKDSCTSTLSIFRRRRLPYSKKWYFHFSYLDLS